MKTRTFPKPILFALLTLVLVQAACSTGASPASPSSSSSSNTSGGTGGDQVTVTGSLSKTYATVNDSIGQFGADKVRLYMNEPMPADKSRAGDLLTLDFASNLQPGTYPFENFINNPSAAMYATYGSTDGAISNYVSTGGSLTLTAVGSTWSGSFQITMQDSMDPSRTITVSGTFTNLAFNQ